MIAGRKPSRRRLGGDSRSCSFVGFVANCLEIFSQIIQQKTRPVAGFHQQFGRGAQDCSAALLLFSICLLMNHCCAIDSTLFTT